MSNQHPSDPPAFNFKVVIQNDGEPPNPYGIVALDRRPMLNEKLFLRRLDGLVSIPVVVDAIRDGTLFVHVKRNDDIDLDSPTRQAWLDGLKEGDPVVIRYTRGMEWEYFQAPVSHIWNGDDASIKKIWAEGSPFNTIGVFSRTRVLVEPTPRTLNEAARTKLLERMDELNWRRLPVTVLTRIVALVDSDSWSDELAEELKLKE
jgi:hypothetical protein